MNVDNRAGEETISLVTAQGCDGLFRMADSSVASDVESTMAEAISLYGRLDYAHNNAGIANGSATSHPQFSGLSDRRRPPMSQANMASSD
jgi:NAD(P)-dependent dehydrogenase (short-subunit alcohol dehydrogenase family)